jgi:hypothetical protein
MQQLLSLLVVCRWLLGKELVLWLMMMMLMMICHLLLQLLDAGLLLPAAPS